MKKYSSQLLDLFTEDVLKKSYERTFLPEETIKFIDDDNLFFVLEGSIRASKPPMLTF